MQQRRQASRAQPSQLDKEQTSQTSKCDTCNKNLKRNSVPLKCGKENCNNTCHKQEKCSKIKRYSEETKWLCSRHKGENTQLSQAESQEALEQPSQSPRPIKCDTCKKKIKSNITPLICASGACNNVCHKQEKCSKIKRYSSETAWLCSLHQQDDTQSLQEDSQEESQEEEEPEVTLDQKVSCNSCKKRIKREPRLLKCTKCQHYSHKQTKCSGLTLEGTRIVIETDTDFTCTECENREDRDYITKIKPHRNISEKISGPQNQQLTILQWNADGLTTKVIELTERLKEDNVDIANIQETKLKPHMKTPRIPGYRVATRADRHGTRRGGGLITYIKDTIIFEAGPKSTTQGTEVTSIKVRMSKTNWATITNVYVPPHNSTGEEISFIPDNIPTPSGAVITGDFNAHSPIWDDFQPADARGDEVETWTMLQGLSILNNSQESTHVNKITGGLSSPSLSMVGKTHANYSTWKVGEQLSHSDHLPIIITLNAKTVHQPILGREPRWRKHDIDWKGYQQELETKMDQLEECHNLKTRLERFNKLVTQAAHKHVGKTKPRKSGKTYITPDVKKAIKKRSRLRKNVKEHKEEWLQASKEVQEKICSTKEEKWKELITSVMSENECKVWSLI